MTCPDCEYHKSRAAMWRHEAYKIGGTPLPWDVDEALKAAVLAEREACAKIAQAWDVAHPDTNYGRCIANEIRNRK